MTIVHWRRTRSRRATSTAFAACMAMIVLSAAFAAAEERPRQIPLPPLSSAQCEPPLAHYDGKCVCPVGYKMERLPENLMRCVLVCSKGYYWDTTDQRCYIYKG